jgi:hypothetical protein
MEAMTKVVSIDPGSLTRPMALLTARRQRLYDAQQHSTILRLNLGVEAPSDFMHSVRIRGQNYRISNETLDRVFGGNWRRSDRGLLRKHIEDQHDAGKLVVQGQRLQVATKIEEAEQQLRSAETEEEILRWGLLYLASQISEAATELRALRETLLFDESAATAKLSRDSAHEQEEREERG